MAVAPTFPERNIDTPVNDCKLVKWSLIQGQAGTPFKVGEYNDKTIQFIGTFDALDTVKFRGSLLSNPNPDTAADWFALHDAACGAQLNDVTEAGGSAIMELALWVSPIIDDGGGSSQVDFILFANKRN